MLSTSVFALGCIVFPAQVFLITLSIVLAITFISLAVIKYPAVGFVAFFSYAPLHCVLRPMLLRATNLPTPLFSCWQDYLFLLMCIGTVRKGTFRRFKFQPLDWTVALLFLFGVGMFLSSRDFIFGIYGFRVTYLPMLFFFLMRAQNIAMKSATTTAKFLIGILTTMAIIGILFTYLQPTLGKQFLKLALRTPFMRAGSIRMSGTMYSAVAYGAIMAVGGILSTACALRRSAKDRRRICWFLCSLLFGICVFASLSRGAWLSLITGVVTVMLLMLPRRNIMHVLVGVGLVMLLIIVLCTNSSSEKAALLFSIPDVFDFKSEYPDGRTDLWRESVALLRDHPLGLGLGRAGHVAHRFKSAETGGLLGVSALDGWYTKAAAEGGVLGALIFLTFVVMTAKSLYRLHLEQDSRSTSHTLTCGTLGAFVGFSIQGIGSNVWDFFIAAPLMWALLGMAYSPEWKEGRPEDSSFLKNMSHLKFSLKLCRGSLLLGLFCTTALLWMFNDQILLQLKLNPYLYKQKVPAMISNGDYDAVEAILAQAKTLRPNESGVAFYSAKLHWAKNEPEKALDDLIMASTPEIRDNLDFVELAPGPSQEDQVELFHALERRLVGNSNCTPLLLFKLGAACGRLGFWARAYTYFDRAKSSQQLSQASSDEIHAANYHFRALAETLFSDIARIPEGCYPVLGEWNAKDLAYLLELAGANQLEYLNYQDEQVRIPCNLIVSLGHSPNVLKVRVNWSESILTKGGYLGMRINSETGKMTNCKYLGISSMRMLGYVQEIRGGDIVILAGFENPIVSPYGRRAVSLIGGNTEEAVEDEALWAIIGIKGMRPGEAVQVSKSPGDSHTILFSTIHRTRPMRVVGKSYSSSALGEGETFRIDYQIYSPRKTHGWLGCTLTAPNGVRVTDASNEGSENEIIFLEGIHWYSRDFSLELPLQTENGSYDVALGVHCSSEEFDSVFEMDALTVADQVRYGQ
ncbi:O-antigen ligase family protein [Candidatus Hydrogenedentota bacterium]